MKKIIIFLLFIIGANTAQSQTLSIEETVDYINDNLEKYSKSEFSDGTYSILIETNGFLTLKYTDNKSKPLTSYSVYKMYWNDIEVNQNKCYNSPCINLECKGEKRDGLGLQGPTCISYSSGRSMNIDKENILIFGQNNADRIFKAFEYLFSELRVSDKYNDQNYDDDPFSNNNLKGKKSFVSGSPSTENINLETYGGVYKVWVKIGSLEQHFVLDSGASEISLSKNTERELIDNGIVTKGDYIEPALFKLADGSIIECRRLIIPEMTIGNYTIKNIKASVGVSESPLLLGRSFLDNFSKWSIDNKKQILILEK